MVFSALLNQAYLFCLQSPAFCSGQSWIIICVAVQDWLFISSRNTCDRFMTMWLRTPNSASTLNLGRDSKLLHYLAVRSITRNFFVMSIAFAQSLFYCIHLRAINKMNHINATEMGRQLEGSQKRLKEMYQRMECIPEMGTKSPQCRAIR